MVIISLPYYYFIGVMMNYFRKILLSIVVSCLSSNLFPATQAPLLELMQDMQSYKTTNARFHAGHVFEHSVWVARATINLMKTPWNTKCECEQSLRNIILACLLHDLGKCGDGVYEFNEKPQHPAIGFEYLTGQRAYIKQNGESFSFQTLYESLGLGQDDVAFIAIVAGMHHDLGGLMRGLRSGKMEVFAESIAKLDGMVQMTGYMGGKLAHNDKAFKKLIKCICLISTADVISAQVVPYAPEHEIIDTMTGLCLLEVANCKCETLSEGLNGYKFFDYDNFGFQAKANWLAICQ